MDYPPVPFLIDYRDGSRDLVRYPVVHEHAQIADLDSGDVMIVGNGPGDVPTLVGVEVKSLYDLVSSMNTGRLQGVDGQIPRMLEQYDVCWLLYFGPYRISVNGVGLEVFSNKHKKWQQFKLGSRPVPYGYVESLLFDLTCLGFRIKHTYDEREAAIWLAALHRWWSKPWDRHRGLHTFNHSRDLSLMPDIPVDLQVCVKVAAQLPGVGFQKAVAAAHHFGSVAAMINASIDDWAQVAGVGKVIARAVVAALG